jgi:hypothetical protein
MRNATMDVKIIKQGRVGLGLKTLRASDKTAERHGSAANTNFFAKRCILLTK